MYRQTRLNRSNEVTLDNEKHFTETPESIYNQFIADNKEFSVKRIGFYEQNGVILTKFKLCNSFEDTIDYFFTEKVDTFSGMLFRVWKIIDKIDDNYVIDVISDIDSNYLEIEELGIIEKRKLHKYATQF